MLGAISEETGAGHLLVIVFGGTTFSTGSSRSQDAYDLVSISATVLTVDTCISVSQAEDCFPRER